MTEGTETRNKLEIPKQLDFNFKTLYHDYTKFKTITKKILGCYEGLDEKYQVDKVLMWMGPEACLKDENRPFSKGYDKKLGPLWTFFGGICTKSEGGEALGTPPGQN